MDAHAEFLAGDRPDEILLYFAEGILSDPAVLAGHGTAVDGGTVVIMPGQKARAALQRALDVDPMAFARRAGGTDGEVERTCTGGRCPTDGDDHDVRFVFAFAEEQNESAGGLYADGDVIHAYAACACGETYADRWVAGSR